jgi:ribosome-binding factor A
VSSQRVAKVESLVMQVAASHLVQLMKKDAAKVTVTRVDVTPDIRNATVWVGVLGNEEEQKKVWPYVEATRAELQEAVAGSMMTKYVPRLTLKLDTGGEYAAKIDKLLRQTP